MLHLVYYSQTSKESLPAGKHSVYDFLCVAKFYPTLKIMYVPSQKKFTCLLGCEIERLRLIFKTEMLIYHSKTILDEKLLFDKIIHYLDLININK